MFTFFSLCFSPAVVLLNSKETQAELGWTSYPPNGVSLLVVVHSSVSHSAGSTSQLILASPHSLSSLLINGCNLGRCTAGPNSHTAAAADKCSPSCRSISFVISYGCKTNGLFLKNGPLPSQFVTRFPPDLSLHTHLGCGINEQHAEAPFGPTNAFQVVWVDYIAVSCRFTFQLLWFLNALEWSLLPHDL